MMDSGNSENWTSMAETSSQLAMCVRPIEFCRRRAVHSCRGFHSFSGCFTLASTARP